MEPTYKLIIAMTIAYAPFILYWIAYIRRINRITAAERRRHGEHIDHYWGE